MAGSHLDAQTVALEQFVAAFDVPFAAVLGVAERMAERRLESSAGLTRGEMELLLNVRGLDGSARLVRECGQTWTSEQVAARLNISRQAVHERKQQNRLLAFTLPVSRGDRYPVWQFRGRHVRSWVPEIVAELGNGFAALHFLLVARKSLGGRRYLDLALSGKDEIIAKMLKVVRGISRD
ncbi:MAG: hypothetical protein H7X97_09275 [Opitutaceae bacterium]|nr:hypothetical protein [Verrucomicrobiales bacterium]